MNNPKYEFRLIRGEDGQRAILPGRVLIMAKTEPMSIPLEGGGMASLTHTPWYDQYHLSTPEECVYGNIQQVEFEADAMYSVFFFNRNVQTAYMMAIKIPK